jgi:6-phosphogluconolactonase
LTFKAFDNQVLLNQEFCEQICSLLSEGIATRGNASLMVSGGRTPIPLFTLLSEQSIDWSKVTISLIDDRWVDIESDASNEKLVKSHLLQNKAAQATFVSLVKGASDIEQDVATLELQRDDIPQPFDVVVLGMGEDGHTASLFPCCEQIKDGLDLNNPQSYIATIPTTAPHKRISLTLAALLKSRKLFLHLTGEAKKSVYNEALAKTDPFEMPIRAVLQNTDVDVLWAP